MAFDTDLGDVTGLFVVAETFDTDLFDTGGEGEENAPFLDSELLDTKDEEYDLIEDAAEDALEVAEYVGKWEEDGRGEGGSDEDVEVLLLDV